MSNVLRPFTFIICLALAGCNTSRSPQPPPSSDTPEVNEQRLERLIHHRINDFREEQGLEPLAWDDELSEIAAGHSRNMARRDYFSHVSPDGATPSERAIEAGYTCRKQFQGGAYAGIGENIYYISQYESYRITRRGAERSVDYDWKSLEEIAEQVADGWIDSPGHRRNILTRRYTREGIGAYRADDYRIYVTQNFC